MKSRPPHKPHLCPTCGARQTQRGRRPPVTCWCCEQSLDRASPMAQLTAEQLGRVLVMQASADLTGDGLVAWRKLQWQERQTDAPPRAAIEFTAVCANCRRSLPCGC